MTAALYYVAPGALDGLGVGGLLVLDGDEGHHAARVKRARVGEELLVADTVGMVAHCCVESLGPGSVSLRVVSVGLVEVGGPRFVLVQALAKGGRDEQAIETATELGVDAVVAWQADRSIVRWSGKEAKALAKWAGVLRAAGKQSRRAVVPAVSGPVTTAQLAQLLRGAAAFVLHEEASERLVAQELPAEGDVYLVVGPEGGIAPAELTALSDAGALPVRLGSEVLRSSSAGPAALAVLAARTRW
ncbi:16S rRNA (uracil1498-N3)-methyltransferase [Kineosphaera limosa]|uniref:Ribosomal RNA small subunit methyltransferase E n=1 Tax=Kineosphaera limosa NBRC 100340 TaxID=1184609 RepID=K6WKR7_9MICO|nr:16S rRNA (uracil(1498)-N(3))-methyltransferase [Kineosphaera limosa]NYE02940.1 16S rRNA (uracil1498-N3)-methyltransferase [Kineosphaera limosa]GAB94371.1 hypothetical protein KILIM_004_01630 [Kineosphaera limosa NBRC 100340]